MRYGNPSIAERARRSCTARGCERILVLPLYPQYAASTTATALDAVLARCARMRRIAGAALVDSFHDDPGYIRALAQSVSDYWMQERPARTGCVMSFHGLPRRTLDRGDPYHCQCQKTARLLADGARARRTSSGALAFQSRFGRAEWLKPYTADDAGRARAARASRASTWSARASSPTASRRSRRSASRASEAFLEAGGKEFHAHPLPQRAPGWIAALADLALATPAGLARRAARTPRRASDAAAGQGARRGT